MQLELQLRGEYRQATSSGVRHFHLGSDKVAGT